MLRNSIFVILLIIIGCNSKPILSGFDTQSWQKDVDGCENLRVKLVDEVITRKAELVGLGQKDILKVLGKPTRHELYSRHKKAFVYTVKGSENCPEYTGKASKLVIRFDALERTKEIILYK